ncbi:lysozyme C, milk isozyme isoform X1 [Anolis carolinensis]|uniref:lysozyme C, milk isozyme isoform X1 n=1 Tax=Anolis carolinensis TaxID=28377 RepID=UPI002F2B489E
MLILKLMAPFLIFLLIGAGETKIISRCALANLIADLVPDGYARYTINDWICLAHSASYFDSMKISKQEEDSARRYGIFQFSNMEHCSDGCRSSLNICRTQCTNFINDDLRDDIRCVMKIIRADTGFDEWRVYGVNCKGKNLARWIQGCTIVKPWDKWR